MQDTVSTYVGQLGDDGLIRINGVTDMDSPTFDVLASSHFSQTLHRVIPVQPETFAARIGTYSDGDITVAVAMNAEPTDGEPYAFYADLDHNALVRLYAISDEKMLSEQGEELVFHEDGSLTLAIDGCQTLLQRAQLPVEEEVEFAVSGASTKLSGTLLRPTADGPTAGVVIAHDEIAPQRDFYRGFAACLLRAGTAVLIFDRREADSEDASNSGIQAALDYLRGRDDVDQLGLWGLGNGMHNVATVASQRADLAFVAGMSAPGVGEGKGNGKTDPVDVYRNMPCPVLLQYGVHDSQPSAKQSAERVAKALNDGDNNAHTVSQYEDAGHLLERVPDNVAHDSWSESASRLHGIRFSAGVLTELTDWVASATEKAG